MRKRTSNKIYISSNCIYINKYFIQDIESFNNQQEFNKLQNEDASNNSNTPLSDLTKQVNLFPETIVEKSLNNLYNGPPNLFVICHLQLIRLYV